MELMWTCLIPPALVFLTVFLFKNVLLALALGIISGAFVVTHGSITAALSLMIKYSWNQITDADTFNIFCFLSFLGALIALVNQTGGMMVYGQRIKRSLTDARSAELSSIGLSFSLFFDDFFNSITTGNIMKPITDHFLIPRAKLAFLIDSMAAPLAILVPLSSWIAMLLMQLTKAGIAEVPTSTTTIVGDPFTIYLKIIPFIFYSFLMIASVIFIVYRNISFGTMRIHEKIAVTTGNLFGGKDDPHILVQKQELGHGTLSDFFIPIGILILSIVTALLYLGKWWIFGGTNSLGIALTQAPIFLSLAVGSGVAFGVSSIFVLLRKTVKVEQLPSILYEGIKPMAHVMIILLCAWIFSSLMVNDLKSGEYVATLLGNSIHISLLPALCFALAALTSISVGSSWGTIAILTPLAIPTLLGFTHLTLPLAPEQLPLLFPLLGAIFAGAVAGDHVSPLSSTTIMSSTSSGAYHFDHVRTQFEYAAPALIASFCGYLLCGWLSIAYGPWIALVISLPMALVGCLVLLSLLNKPKD